MITIVHPSRGRAEIAFKTYNRWKQQAFNPFEYYVSIEKDQLDYYGQYFDTENIIVSENNTAIEAINNAVKKIDHFDILIIISDDFLPPYKWDISVEMAVDGKSDFVLKTFDGLQRWIVTLPIMDKNYYDRFGYVYDPIFSHLFSDTQLTHIADLNKKLIIRNDITFKHNQIYDNNKKITNRTWDEGKMVYLNNCKNKFGIKEDINILDLTRPEANNHLEWLKKELV